MQDYDHYLPEHLSDRQINLLQELYIDDLLDEDFYERDGETLEESRSVTDLSDESDGCSIRTESLDRPLSPESTLFLDSLRPGIGDQKVDDEISHHPNSRNVYNPALELRYSHVWNQRLVLFLFVICANAACFTAALLPVAHHWVFAFILFVKAKDCLSSMFTMTMLSFSWIYRQFNKEQPIDPKWILTLIPAYSESEEQIVKTIFSLRDNDVYPHKQVMCLMLDGIPRDIRAKMTHILKTFRRPYLTSKFRKGELLINVGFMEDVPVIVFEKRQNAGKKDSLILCHDLFDWPRRNIPVHTRLLREDFETIHLPLLTKDDNFKGFDMIFCTDADSIVYKGAIARLANALSRDEKAIAVCGVLLAELEEGHEWSIWTLYQLFQYSFGQYVRRRAESFWGRVTCLPGCINMIKVRKEMAEAIRLFAAPVETWPILMHQVQYLGTDRRLTYLMLQQSKDLHTLMVPDAYCETAVPQSLRHYLSQRRRWGSNAYFNDFFYLFGKKNRLITRVCALNDVVRLTTVYYRVANTGLFLYDLYKRFSVVNLVPFIVVSQFASTWFAFTALVLQPELRNRAGKLVVGFGVNKVLSFFISVAIFSTVVWNLGSQGMTKLKSLI